MDKSTPPNPSISALVDVLGLDDTRELVRTYLREFDGLIRTLAGGTHEAKHRTAHALKSSARHMGAHSLSQRMAALELRLQSPAGEVTADDLCAITEEFERSAGPLRVFATSK